ncbi:MAG: hypothetical protein ACRD8O_21590 [Bryobacteraceae bacterium]
MAKRLDVDPGTLARRERGEREPTGSALGRVKRFVDDLDERQSRPRLWRGRRSVRVVSRHGTSGAR